MTMLKDLFEYVVGMSRPETFNFAGKDFTDKPLYPVPEATVDSLKVYTLDAILDYLRDNKDELTLSNLTIHIESPTQVSLVDMLDNTWMRRKTYVLAKCDPPEHAFGRYIDLDTFVPYLKACYEQTEDGALLMSVLGNIVDEESVSTEDDGITQSVTAKRGVRLVGNTQLPNPVWLRPFCTFPEVICQPQRPFVFRIAPNGKAGCLIPADGGAWQGEAISIIRNYLENALENLPEVKSEIGIIA